MSWRSVFNGIQGIWKKSPLNPVPFLDDLERCLSEAEAHIKIRDFPTATKFIELCRNNAYHLKERTPRSPDRKLRRQQDKGINDLWYTVNNLIDTFQKANEYKIRANTDGMYSGLRKAESDIHRIKEQIRILREIL